MHTILWKRLDQEGHDACRFAKTAGGWTIEGAAVFEHDGNPANLAYRLVCDQQWTSLEASVSGWIGRSNIRINIERADDDGWCVNGKKNKALAGLKDIDVGFTPASNTNAIRRLNLSESDEAKSVAVWLDTADWTIKPLPQTYRRVHGHAYEYTSPQHDYRATLLVDGFGAVTDYPGLWVMRRHSEA
ncbi:putative glycolipid-binding domain-containing protein (plasmid) [Aquicoccus sp. G2-2]|uniref:putative glycolipid-binding domain-containing protein n=1 Tax=Aquicoccus sp. G2-2 TaxID=3092120 RepID=UPI002AE0058F|nr:putative glycolipid-binding domain-containing protein [Aquicoccus sp. G2-2]MEA1111993.1 putative glycolipid-binding domain-containing protein [Aquicoccus sp. G2-2]